MKPPSVHKLAEITLIALSTMILFIAFNVIGLYAWKAYSANNTNPLTRHPVRENFSDLDDHELDGLFTQTWEPGWQYEPWVGFTEAPRTGEHVTVYEDGFRRTVGASNLLDNPNTRKLFFFGGSTTFGYNVADQHTIPSHFQRLAPQYDVFNFGRGYYYSKQENILLIDLLDRGHRPDVAIFINGLNERCIGHAYQDELSYFLSLAQNRRGEKAADWMMLALSQLPVLKAINKVRLRSSQANLADGDCSVQALKELWKSRLMARKSICAAFDIRCFTFLQPLAGVHGKHEDLQSLDEAFRSKLSAVYQSLRPLEDDDWFDISDSLDGILDHAYVDNVHYSPQANEGIASAVAQVVLGPEQEPGGIQRREVLTRFWPAAIDAVGRKARSWRRPGQC